MKAFFESVSTDWDDMRSSFYNKGVIDALAQRTEADTSKTIVDVGTGTGFVAAGMAPYAARVIGVDNSAAMLSVARTNLEGNGDHPRQTAPLAWAWRRLGCRQPTRALDR